MTNPADSTAFDACVQLVRNGGDAHDIATAFVELLTPAERLGLLDGDFEFWDGFGQMVAAGYNRTPIPMGCVDRLGLPGLRFSDGPRGCVMGSSTAFPVSMARGATWDVELEERIGTAIGLEMRAQGGNFFGGVCINLPRHPAWGRAQETYSEDPLLLGEFGAALTRGVAPNGMTVAKHYALNSMENARFKVNVIADDASLHEVYLAHFRRVVEEGVSALMTSYNAVNGEWAGQNEALITDILRGQWGFAGITVSDFVWGLRDAAKSLRAGLDVEEPFRQQRAMHLEQDLAEGRADWADVDAACARIVATQLRHYAVRATAEPAADVVFSAAHRALAREAAQRSMVLLQNESVEGAPLLPLAATALRSVAVIGRLADVPNTGDNGSSHVRSPEVVTPLAGISAALPAARVTHVAADNPEEAAAAAAAADVAVIVVGYTAKDEGEYVGGDTRNDPLMRKLLPPMPAEQANEPMKSPFHADTDGPDDGTPKTFGGDRASLRLRPVDADIIRAVAAANPRTIVAVVTAGAVITEEWRHDVPALLVSWYSGSEGGHALADVLLGKVDAAGRLPFSIPTSEAHLPFFDREATEIVYDKWFGQRLLDRDGHAAAFPLGYGRSYTSFECADVEVGPIVDEEFTVTVEVHNTGERAGRHVVQVYATVDAADFPAKVLVGFAVVDLAAGETRRVTVLASSRPLQRWTAQGFVPAAATAGVEVAAHAADPAALGPVTLTLTLP